MHKAHPLRVLVVGYGGGGITFLTRLVKGLADAGIDVTVTSPKQTNPLLLKHPCVHRLRTPAWEGNWGTRLLRLFGLFINRFSLHRINWLWQQIRSANSVSRQLVLINRYLPFMRVEWDLVYFPWNSAAVGYQGLYDLGLPVVVSCRGSQVNIRPHLPGQAAYIKNLSETLKKAAGVHCVSEDIQIKAQNYALDPHKSVIIQPAVDPDVFKPSKTHPLNDRLKLITTGSLIWSKGYEYMLLALKALIDRSVNAELHILGEGPMRQSILFTIHDLGLDGRVHLHGRVAPGQVLTNLQQADVFVLSSLSEGISNALLEAMSVGLPVVTTDCGGMAEAVSDGVEGFLVPVRDPNAMADALLKLAGNPSLHKRMGDAGRERILKNFLLDKQVSSFIDLFQSAVETKDWSYKKIE